MSFSIAVSLFVGQRPRTDAIPECGLCALSVPVWPCLQPLRRRSRELSQRCSACSSCVASANHYPSPSACALVAVSSNFVATTAQPALGLDQRDGTRHGPESSKRTRVVADGLPLDGGAQLAVDTALVSALRGDGSPKSGAGDRDGVALTRAQGLKERTYPELVGSGARARLFDQLRLS